MCWNKTNARITPFILVPSFQKAVVKLKAMIEKLKNYETLGRNTSQRKTHQAQSVY